MCFLTALFESISLALIVFMCLLCIAAFLLDIYFLLYCSGCVFACLTGPPVRNVFYVYS